MTPHHRRNRAALSTRSQAKALAADQRAWMIWCAATVLIVGGAVALSLAVLTKPAGAQTQTGGETAQADAIRGVIQRQLDAFQRDDAGAAFAIAAPTIQQKFGNPSRFLAIVKQHYAPVYRPQGVRFLGLKADGNGFVQRVLLTGPDESLVTAVYTLTQIDGVWRITGCFLEQPTGAA